MTRALPLTDHQPAADDVRRALRWSLASILWTVAASTIAITAGVLTGTLLLVVFGAVGALDAAGSIVLAVHFRHALHHEAISESRERRALVVIATGMTAIALATTAESVHRLARHGGDATFSSVGTAVAAASIAALAVLGLAKHRVGGRVRSRALVADGHVSMMGAVLAAFTCSGTLATSGFDWWWLDPTGSLVVALVAVSVAFSHLRNA